MDNNPEQAGSQKESGGDSPPPSPMRAIVVWSLVIFTFLAMFLFVKSQKEVDKKISYNPDFRNLVVAGRIIKCEVIREVSGQVEYVKGVIEPEEGAEEEEGAKPDRFRVYIGTADAELREFLTANGVEFSYPPQNPYLWHMISSLLPVVLIFGLIYFLFIRQVRAAGSGALNFGKSRAKLLNRENKKTTFANVAGIDEAKEEVQEIIDFLKDPKKFQKLGGRIPTGVLLMGAPGTGKTLLAKAIAGEAEVPFFSISGSDFVEMFVGVGASRVRDMFEQGKKNAPCIIFIDEIDAVGRSRFTGIGGGHDEREQTLNALLVQMDGFETQEGVIILAATNRPDVLDPALLRPGRFDRQIVIDLPMIDGREAILKMHAARITLSETSDLRRLARGTPGFSGADLENLLNEAALLAARNEKSAVEMEDLEEARDKVKWGRERRSRKFDEKEKRITACHESGHALVQQVVEESDPLHKITIIPRGVAYLGATMSLPEKDHLIEGKKKLLDSIVIYMGGRAAESIVLKELTTGASSDLKEATRIARLMVCDWGMSETLGPQRFADNEELMFLGREVSRSQNYSEETAKAIDVEISGMLKAAYDRAESIIVENRAKLDTITELLLERETIDGRDVEEIVEHGRVLSEEERTEIDKKEEEKSPKDDAADTAAETPEQAEPHVTSSEDVDVEEAVPGELPV